MLKATPKKAVSSSEQPDYASRLNRLRALFDANAVDSVVVSSRENVRYLLGFAGSSGWVFITHDDAVLMTDSRYIEHARATIPVGHVQLSTDGLPDTAADLITDSRCKACGFEADNLTHSMAGKLQDKVKGRKARCALLPVDRMVDRLRMTKDNTELGLIKQAAQLADGALEHVRSVLHPGMTELHAAWEVEKWLREHGSEPIPFNIIAASGPNSALPHAEPGKRTLEAGDPIVFDLGARLGGYCSDLSRTVFVGEPDAALRRIYDIVLTAQRAALTGVRSGMTAVQTDALARDIISSAGYGEYFGHGLGHGVGLAIHESPTVSPRSIETLEETMVFTIEPGIYVPGVGGVRIEDTVVLRDGAAIALTCTDKDNPTIPLP